MASKLDWKALGAMYTASTLSSAQRVSLKDAVAGHIAALDAWDAAEERAAIQEYDGGLSRLEAEAMAFAEVKGVCWWEK